MLKTLVRLVVVAALGAFVVVVLYQRERINALAAETAMLRQQLQQVAVSKQSNEQIEPLGADGSNSTPSLTEEQSRELLRLRGQVGVLRRQLADTLAQAVNEQSKQRVAPEQTGALTKADFDNEQLQSLIELTSKVETGTSVEDLARLKDSFERWDELFMNRASAEHKPVLAVLKERVKERISELEAKK